MTPAPVPAVAAPPDRPVDPRLARCRPDLRRYALLLLQLAGVLVAFKKYAMGDFFGESFWRAVELSAAGFAVHYWLPLRWKEPFCIALSLAGAGWILGPVVAGELLLLGLLFFGIGCLPVRQVVRVALMVAVGAVCTWGRARGIDGLPDELWPVVGSLFIFRLLIWTYDLRHMKGKPSLRDFLAYFFMLPNWGCLLFPVVDFHTQRKSFLARDHHEIAQQGIAWMARGLVQLVLYQWLHYRKVAADPYTVNSLPELLLCMVGTYLLYLRLSGTFHLVVGMVHLFGYDLPETHRRYLFASSLTDFWRRINIYWKDFMVKLVWFPAYFRWRRQGERKAQLAATLLVFAATWFLHAWQTFWTTGTFLLRSTDAAFWGVLGLLVVGNLWLELRRPKQPANAPPPSLLVRVVKVAATFTLITVLWSMWNARSFAEWQDLMTWWRRNG